MAQVSGNPFNVKFDKVTIVKFNGNDSMEITPQVIEFTLYQTIFDAMIKADMVIGEGIGLMNNYPWSGEEVVTVEVVQDGEETPGTGQKSFRRELKFVISAIKDIVVADDARNVMYAIELVSVEAFTNAKTRVSHAYNEDIETMIQDVYEKYIVKTNPNAKALKIFPDTKKIRKLVIPMLKPFDAISWLCKFAISDTPDKTYTHVFYETLDNFTFKSLQKKTFRGDEDDLAVTLASREKYFYISNLEVVKKDTQAYNALVAQGFSDTRTINDLKMNKRYSALEKIVGGYYENDIVEINALLNDYKITNSQLKYKDYEFTTLHPGSGYNTKEYIENVIKEYEEPESSPRVRYIMNNFDDANQPSFRDKFGKSARSFLAFQQVDLTISVAANLLQRPGDLIWVELPEFHGFNVNKRDDYLSGLFITSEIKTVMRVGGRSQSYLRINKDSFTQNLALNHNYNFNATSPQQTSSANTRGPR